MSKQSKKRAKKRQKHRDRVVWEILCPSCGNLDDGSVAALVTGVADALNACADSGAKVRLFHGIVTVEAPDGGGFVLPVKGGRWAARNETYDRFEQAPLLPDEMDD
jgi:hypothetical protein